MTVFAKDKDPEIRLGVDASPLPQHYGKALSVSAGLSGEYWRLSLLDNLEELGSKASISSHEHNCLEPNPFFKLSFLEPAINHLSKGEIKILGLTRHDATACELKLFLPVTIKTSWASSQRVMRSWTHEFAPLGTPFISRKHVDETISAFIHCLMLAQNDYADALVIDHLPKKSLLSEELHRSQQLADRSLRYAPKTRAGISSTESLHTCMSTVSGSRKQRLNASLRKLQNIGSVSYSIEASGEKLHSALLDHVQIEHEGWKGRRGTSILSDTAVQQFVFSAVANLEKDKCCSIHSLKLNGIPIASMITIENDGHYYPWKIAFDESYTNYSVGNLLVSHVNNTLLETGNFRSLDSLASDLNKTALRFWPDGQELTSIVIGFGAQGGKTALDIAAREQSFQAVKRRIKLLTGRLL